MKGLTRRDALAWGGAWAAAGLAGCAAEPAAVQRVPPQRSALLTPWLTLNGGWRLEGAQRLPLAPAQAGPRLRFAQPVGVAARGDIVVVADAGARVLWRMDRPRDAMSPFAPFTGWGGEQGASLAIGSDFSVWAALPAEHAVVQYDARGRELRRWRDDLAAPRPVAVAPTEDRSELLVADGASARIAVFDRLGHVVRMLDGGRVGVLQSVSAMAFGPRGLYVLDRLAQQVFVLGARGEPLDAAGESVLVQPRALAVDGNGRVFVSDDADQQVKVFRGQRLLTAFGGVPGGFGRIESLAVDGNLLYVADSARAVVHVLMVAPPTLENAEAPP